MKKLVIRTMRVTLEKFNNQILIGEWEKTSDIIRIKSPIQEDINDGMCTGLIKIGTGSHHFKTMTFIITNFFKS